MKVSLLSFTPYPDSFVTKILPICRRGFVEDCDVSDIKPNKELITRIIEQNHLSVFEHVVFTFYIDGISRVCSHQLVRHRIASYLQRSDRCYDALRCTDDIALPEDTEKLLDDSPTYKKLLQYLFSLKDILLKRDVKRENIRYLYPMGLETSLVVTMNGRSLYNFFDLRCCKRAQKEIRDLAFRMLNLVKDKAPFIFSKAGPYCVHYGRCMDISKGSVCSWGKRMMEVL